MRLRSTTTLHCFIALCIGCGSQSENNRQRIQRSQSYESGEKVAIGTTAASDAKTSKSDQATLILGLLPEVVYSTTTQQKLQAITSNRKVSIAAKNSIKVELQIQGGSIEKGLLFPASPLLCQDKTAIAPSTWRAEQHEQLMLGLAAKLQEKGVHLLDPANEEPATTLTLWLTPALYGAICNSSKSHSIAPWNEGNLIANHHGFLVTQDRSESTVLDDALSIALAAIGRAHTESTNLLAPTTGLVAPSTTNFLQLARLTPQLELITSLTVLTLPNTVKRWLDEREALPLGVHLNRRQIIPTLVVINYLGLLSKPQDGSSSWSLLHERYLLPSIATQIAALTQDWIGKTLIGLLQSVVFPLKIDTLTSAISKEPATNLPPQLLSQALQLSNLSSKQQILLTLLTLNEATAQLQSEAERQAARQLLLWTILDLMAQEVAPL